MTDIVGSMIQTQWNTFNDNGGYYTFLDCKFADPNW